MSDEVVAEMWAWRRCFFFRKKFARINVTVGRMSVNKELSVNEELFAVNEELSWPP